MLIRCIVAPHCCGPHSNWQRSQCRQPHQSSTKALKKLRIGTVPQHFVQDETSKNGPARTSMNVDVSVKRKDQGIKKNIHSVWAKTPDRKTKERSRLIQVKTDKRIQWSNAPKPKKQLLRKPSRLFSQTMLVKTSDTLSLQRVPGMQESRAHHFLWHARMRTDQ